MALDFKWTDRVDGVDINSAKDINEIAHEVEKTQKATLRKADANLENVSDEILAEKIAPLVPSSEKTIITVGQTSDCDYVISGIALTPAIAQAVAEASDGDTIYIKKPATLDPMWYDMYFEDNGTDIIVDKNITITAEMGVIHSCMSPGTIIINPGCVLTIDGVEIQSLYDCKRTVVGGYETARGFVYMRNTSISTWPTPIIGEFENCQITVAITNPSVNIDPMTYSPIGGIDNKYKNCTFNKMAEFVGNGGHIITDSRFELFFTQDDANGGGIIPRYTAPVTINNCTVIHSGPVKISLSNMMSGVNNTFYYGDKAFETNNTAGCFLVNATPI